MVATWLKQMESITLNSNCFVVPCNLSYPSFAVNSKAYRSFCFCYRFIPLVGKRGKKGKLGV